MLVLAAALILAGVLLLIVAVTGSTFGETIRGQANTTQLHNTPGA